MQASHPSKRPWARAAGASAMMEGRDWSRAEPACSRRCMHRMASAGDITPMWCVARETCMARERPRCGFMAGEELAGRVAASHS
eukprot:6173494-Pleurochrysis_carterae.AAC.5